MIELSISQELRELEPSNKEQIAQERPQNKTMLLSLYFYFDPCGRFTMLKKFGYWKQFSDAKSLAFSVVFFFTQVCLIDYII